MVWIIYYFFQDCTSTGCGKEKTPWGCQFYDHAEHNLPAKQNDLPLHKWIITVGCIMAQCNSMSNSRKIRKCKSIFQISFQYVYHGVKESHRWDREIPNQPPTSTRNWVIYYLENFSGLNWLLRNNYFNPILMVIELLQHMYTRW